MSGCDYSGPARRLPVLSVRWLESEPAVVTASASMAARGAISVSGEVVRTPRPAWDPLAGDGLIALVAGAAYGVATDNWHWPAGQALALAVLVYFWLSWLLAQRP